MEMSPNFVVILNRLSGGHLTQKGRGQIARKRKSNFGRFSALYTFSNHNNFSPLPDYKAQPSQPLPNEYTKMKIVLNGAQDSVPRR